jgi:hypothetical protein
LQFKVFPYPLSMAEVVQETRQEFWRPPIQAVVEEMAAAALPTMAEACSRCGTEFLLGSRFCHTCGGRRSRARTAVVANEQARADAADLAGLWEHGVARVQAGFYGLWACRIRVYKTWKRVRFPAWLRYLHFHEIQHWVGLSTASLIAFILGVGCIAGALLVGLLTAKNFVDWQAIQFYRAEWLLAATAAFVAGILLKKTSNHDPGDGEDGE